MKMRLLFPVSIACLLALGAQEVYAFMPLHMLAVRGTDLRQGYSQTSGLATGYLTEKFIAYQENVSVQQLQGHGWANSYGALYQYRQNSDIEVTNQIDEYTARGGARWGYGVSVGNTTCCGASYHVIAMPRVGNASTAFIDRQSPHGFIGMIFEKGKYVVELNVLPRSQRASLLALARLIAGRIQRYG